jgi:hypothetical protein
VHKRRPQNAPGGETIGYNGAVILHIGGASTAAVLVTVVAIFFLIFAMSFAVGAVPEGQRRFSGEWFSAWFRASLPRLIVAAAFSALLFIGSALSGSGSTTDPGASGPCAFSIGAVAVQPLTDERLVAAVAGFRETAEVARAGDVTGASVAFSGDAHNITHDIDEPLRDADPDLAVALCESVVEIERQFATAADTAVIADESETSAGLLEEAGRVLGITE